MYIYKKVQVPALYISFEFTFEKVNRDSKLFLTGEKAGIDYTRRLLTLQIRLFFHIRVVIANDCHLTVNTNPS